MACRVQREIKCCHFNALFLRGAWQACLKILSGSARLWLWMISSQGQRITYLVLTMFQLKRENHQIAWKQDLTQIWWSHFFKLLFKLCSHLNFFLLRSSCCRWFSRASLALQCTVLNVNMLLSIDLNINLCILNVFYTYLVQRTKPISDHSDQTWVLGQLFYFLKKNFMFRNSPAMRIQFPSWLI